MIAQVTGARRSHFARCILQSPCNISSVQIHTHGAVQTVFGSIALDFCKDDSDLAMVLRAADSLAGLTAVTRERRVHEGVSGPQAASSAGNRRNLERKLGEVWDEFKCTGNAMGPMSKKAELQLLGRHRKVWDAIK